MPKLSDRVRSFGLAQGRCVRSVQLDLWLFEGVAARCRTTSLQGARSRLSTFCLMVSYVLPRGLPRREPPVSVPPMPEGRKHIPATVERAVLVEAGHRCATPVTTHKNLGACEGIAGE
jgi:hypothetical protein